MQKLMLLITLVVMAGVSCAKKSSTSSSDNSSTGGGGGGTPAAPKTIANVWTNDTWNLDLTGARLDGVAFTIAVNNIGGVGACNCQMTMTGTQSAGSCSVQPCVWNNAGSNPGCTSFGGNPYGVCIGGSYSNTGTALHFPSNGFDYH